jgi:Uma2 family endonuclease
VQLTPRKYRQPDLVFLRPERIGAMRGIPVGADLVVEVVSDGPEDRRRDYEEKRVEYAEAQIAEYWIVDPRERQVTILALDAAHYRQHGVFRPGDTATSACFPDLQLTVSELFVKCDAETPSGQRPS